MEMEYFYILAVIAVLSVVQSLFGMGILVFGTPTLLLMGYDFITTPGYLLPTSFAISLLQVMSTGSARVVVSRYLLFGVQRYPDDVFSDAYGTQRYSNWQFSGRNDFGGRLFMQLGIRCKADLYSGR